MRGNGAPFPLFDEQSASVLSPAFHVAPGKAALFQAFDFSAARRQVEEDQPRVAPLVCLRQILYRAPDLAEVMDHWLEEAIGIYMAKVKGLVMAEGPVIRDGREWTLSACNTLAVWDLPGSYRLELNDPASVGQVRVYLRALAAEDMKYKTVGGD